MPVEWVNSRQTALPHGSHCAGSGLGHSNHKVIVVCTMEFLFSLSPNETEISSCISRKRPPLVLHRTRGGLY